MAISIPDFPASTGSAPASTPCPQYKVYRPTPRTDSSNPNASTSILESMDGNQTTRQSADLSILPSGKKSLAGISIRAFFLGQVAGLSILSSILLLVHESPYSPLWRASFFLASLSIFHFLEYYVTARFNTPYATTSAFLLTQNGAAYNLAHTSALAECILSHLFLPNNYSITTYIPFAGAKNQVTLGLVLMVVGQIVRSLAMAQAGTNFTHTIQHRRREDHVLVTGGIYAVLRHPSYFGFFWWGLGTQLVLGNLVCFVAYAVVLWTFFSERIQKEEQLLIKFFGNDYVEYQGSTRVAIPGIR